MPPSKGPQNRSHPPEGLVLSLLAHAERAGVSIGGLFLLVLGIYGGQYAALFPEQVRLVAGGFCIIVSLCGLTSVVFQLASTWRVHQASPGAAASTDTKHD
jgi:hypothetical protein